MSSVAMISELACKACVSECSGTHSRSFAWRALRRTICGFQGITGTVAARIATQTMNLTKNLLFGFLVALPSLPAVAEPGIIKVGALFSLTGFGAEAGTDDLKGALLAQQEINASGGIAGQRVELVTEDFRSETKTAVAGFLKLATVDKVTAIVGPNYSEFVEVVIPAADRHGVPTIATSGYPSAVVESRQSQPYGFVLWPPLTTALEPLLAKVISSGAQRVVVLYAQTGYYEELQRASVIRLRSAGLTVESVPVQPDTMDLKSVVVMLKQKNPDAMVSFLTQDGQIGAFFREAARLKLRVPLFTDSHVTDDKTLASNLKLAEGAIFFRYDIEAKPDFKQKFQLRYGAPPLFTAAKSYDAVYGLKKAIERCGSTRDQVRECLAQAEWNGASGVVTFTKHGALDTRGYYTKLYTISGGVVRELLE